MSINLSITRLQRKIKKHYHDKNHYSRAQTKARYEFLFSGLLTLALWIVFGMHNIFYKLGYFECHLHTSHQLFNIDLIFLTLFYALIIISFLPPILKWLYSSYLIKKHYPDIGSKRAYNYTLALFIWHGIHNFFLLLCLFIIILSAPLFFNKLSPQQLVFNITALATLGFDFYLAQFVQG